MENLNSVYVLGTGTSTGVPTLGCSCSVCLSNIPKNKRLRSSIVIRTKAGKNILVDTTPDLRTQLLSNNITDIDSAIITHEHADHTHGIDDLRPFCFFKNHPISVYTSQSCGGILEEKFPYIFDVKNFFKDKKILGGGVPKLELYKLNEGEHIIEGTKFNFFALPHGHITTLGFCTGKFAYIVDCNSIPNNIIQFLKRQKLELLIIDCLRTKKHETHLHLDLSLKYAQEIGALQTGLTHLSHEFDHDKLTKLLEESTQMTVFPLYDNQVLSYS